ncbi:MAG: hypothetical protein KatS3mg002_0227 [Candidatus Woesearchaeota archaeon]|nr:MAG: hypothetical protein KatS3mg002_0227 [Candidatus Woesearchaeota archaeon]
MYRTSGIIIPKSLQASWIDNIINDLNRKTRHFKTKEIEINKFYVYNENSIIIPRNYPIKDYYKNIEIIDLNSEGKDINIKGNITLRNDLQERAKEHILKNPYSLLQLEPGTGKTVITISAICELKKKTLVLVHRDSLVEQWIERFKQFTDIADDRITKLNSNTYIQDLLHKDIVIVTAQTFISILKRDKNKFLKTLKQAEFGIFVADEVHTTLGAKTFSLCSICIPVKRVIGLSATPYRIDGNSDIILYHAGKLFKDTDSAGTVPAKVTFILFNANFSQNILKYISWGGVFRKERYLNKLKDSEQFMKISKYLLDYNLKNKRKVLFIGERINKLLRIMFNSVNCKKSLFIAGIGMDALHPDVDCVFSTPQKMRDGVDAPWLDCIIMTSPIGNIPQMVGRVTRSYSNKSQTLIFDMVDLSINEIYKSAWHRYKYYKEKNWDIQFKVLKYDDSNVKVLDISEEEGKKIILFGP